VVDRNGVKAMKTHLLRLLIAVVYFGTGEHLFGQPGSTQPVESYTHTIQSKRPLEDVVDLLIDNYGVVVHFEDVMVVNPSDIVDESIKKDGSALGRRSKTFNLRIDAVRKRLPDVRAGLESIVQQYNSQDLTGKYRIKPAGPLFSIAPWKAKDRFEVLTETQSPLDVPLTIPEQRLDGLEMMRVFCDALTRASGLQVYPGVSTKAMAAGVGTLKADGEEARLVLARALGSMERKDTRIQAPMLAHRWLLYYSIERKAFLLHLMVYNPLGGKLRSVRESLRSR
jgi:hypothetical protein